MGFNGSHLGGGGLSFRRKKAFFTTTVFEYINQVNYAFYGNPVFSIKFSPFGDNVRQR